MNSLVNSIAKETGPATEDRPSQPHEAPRSQYFSESMAELSLDPLMIDDVEAEIKEAFQSQATPYVKDISLIDDLGQRAVEEIDLLIRLSNPKTEYNPEWLLDSEEPTVMAKITSREDLTDTYKEHLIETYDFSETLASELVDLIVSILELYEAPILSYYAVD